jgi:hypothetical protein
MIPANAGGWSDLSAAVTSDPSCVNDEAGNIICAQTRGCEG